MFIVTKTLLPKSSKYFMTKGYFLSVEDNIDPLFYCYCNYNFDNDSNGKFRKPYVYE